MSAWAIFYTMSWCIHHDSECTNSLVKQDGRNIICEDDVLNTDRKVGHIRQSWKKVFLSKGLETKVLVELKG